METPLTPLDFARRARKLYGEREAVVDGKLRLTYAQFFDRCDRWAATLQKLGVAQNDRVAYIAPNTHAQLESFYAVPQIGAVLVPINYRLTADDFAYLINHSGAKIVCAHSDYIKAAEHLKRARGVRPEDATAAFYEGQARQKAGDLAGARERNRLIAQLKQLRSEMLLLAEAERQGRWTPSWQQVPSLPAAVA